MARGKSMLDEIRKELECPVCQEQFSENNEPKILKCQHTFCKSCLNGWLRRHGGGRLSCPNCRVITECPNDNIDCLPTNLGFKNLGVILEAHGDLSNGDRRDIRSQEENICERHRKKLEHYCEQCQICICSDCVIVEHRDPKSHQIVSIEHGAKIQGVIITEKLRSLEAITSRFRRDIATLLERRDKFNTNIEQAVKELHKAAESCRNLIRQHEASVTEQLVRERSLYDNTISQELSKLTGKLEIMASVAIRGRTILENRNIEEMITMKQVLDELTSDKVRPLLRYPDVKYTPNAHPRNLPTGKLFITHTEPSMSVVTGEGLTRGIQSQEANFTVTTKDSTGQTTYSEIDKIIVEITSVRKGIKDIPVVIKELKDGRYSVFYTPNAFGEFRVSIKVRDEPIRGSPFKLRIEKIPKPTVFEGSSKFQGLGVKLYRDWIPQPRNRQGEIHTILDKSKEEEQKRQRAGALSKDIRWMCHYADRVVEYGSVVNAKIEAAYSQNKTGVTITSEEEEDFRIDFSSMTMTDSHGDATPVQRMKENLWTQIIEHEAVTTFSGDNLRKIHTLEQIHDVSVSVEKFLGRIVIGGQPSDVLNVTGEIHMMLHNLKEEEDERKRAEALSKDIRWMNHDGDKFVEYGSLINAKIEAAYSQKITGVTIISEEEEDFRIDFSSMTMTDPRGVATSVQRMDLRKGVLLPTYWIPQPKDSQGLEMTVQLVELDPEKDSQQYKRVQDRFQQTCSDYRIVKIQRVQNPALFGSYMIRKQEMDETKGSNEQWLFHGTPRNNCKLINHTGFNRSFHGKNATVYGNGVYFAEDASYSAQLTYSPYDTTCRRYMYYSRVLVGEYTQGRQGLLTPPQKNPNDPNDTYDSVVDQIFNPKIFVVFCDRQCYPEYLITFF